MCFEMYLKFMQHEMRYLYLWNFWWKYYSTDRYVASYPPDVGKKACM
jgi:hypothetical protein